jgi:formate/nitrite transporter FocA (FNT family)
LGGFYIGLASLVSLMVLHIPDYGRLLSAAVFPVGILLALTANGATFIGVAGQFASRGILSKKANTITYNPEQLKKFGKDLLIALIGNTVGIAALAFLYQNQIGSIDAKVDIPTMRLFTLGILCNIMVYLALNAKTALMQAIPVFIFVLAGFANSIADIALMFFSQQFHWFIIPVLLGNLVGGVVFSAVYEFSKPQQT